MNANNIWNRDAAKMIEANKYSDFFFSPLFFFFCSQRRVIQKGVSIIFHPAKAEKHFALKEASLSM